MTPQEVVEKLHATIGTTATSLVMGSSSRREEVYRWREGSLPIPPEAISRAETALRLIDSVADAEQSNVIALAWFIGGSIDANPGDGTCDMISPMEAIAIGRIEDAEASANALISDSPGY